MEMVKDKENAKHFSLPVNRINTEGTPVAEGKRKPACLADLLPQLPSPGCALPPAAWCWKLAVCLLP